MRTILLNKSDELYLSKCADEHKFAYGLIIGQWVQSGKFIVVHLAKNSEEDEDTPETDGPECVADISSQALATQWISACKMLPGSFDVYGVFAAANATSIVSEESFKHAKKLLADVHSIVQKSNSFFIGNTSLKDEDVEETTQNQNYIFLTYSNTSKTSICMDYTQGVSGGTFSAMESRFVEKPFEWQAMNSNYELNDIFPIKKNGEKLNIEEQFLSTMESVRSNLATSEIFLENENVDDTLTLEAYVRRRFSNSNGNSRKEQATIGKQIINASIFLPVKCQLNSKQPIKVLQFNGTIRFGGVLSSRVWCNAENTVGDIKRYVRNDILRSLATRIQIYCDALTDPSVNEEAVVVCEPPRRVYFNLSTDDSLRPVQFSEYIFRGEAPTVAVAQAKQILDIDINVASIEADLETLTDDSASGSDTYSEWGWNANKNSSLTQTSNDIPKNMYILGVAVAIMVLLFSIIWHILFK